MIAGIRIHPLRRIPDERGTIMHMMRCDDPFFERFGEIYFSSVYPGAIKAWHIHSRMILNYAVVVGMIKLVLYDERPDSPTRGEVQEIYIGQDNYCLVTVPPEVWNGFTAVGGHIAIVANCATEPHDPMEIRRLNPFTDRIPYQWGIKHG